MAAVGRSEHFNLRETCVLAGLLNLVEVAPLVDLSLTNFVLGELGHVTI